MLNVQFRSLPCKSALLSCTPENSGLAVSSRSPNGPGLVHWPLYDASNKYLNLDLQQSEGQDLRKEKIQFFTVELPKRLAVKQELLL